MWKKLKSLHTYNGWIITFLMISGILLFLPSLRGFLSPVRVGLKQLHIGVGIASIIVLLLYLPYLKKHFKSRKQTGKRINLITILSFIVIWSISGLVLTFEKLVSETAVTVSLFLHDLFTWIGLPIILYHSITRLRWVQKQRAPLVKSEGEDGKPKIPLSRRGFIQMVAGTAFVVFIGPSFFKWLKQVMDDGGQSLKSVIANDRNQMSPPPTPLPASSPPQGGGYDGKFRVYTVTEIPKFTNDNWSFTVDGMVDHPVTYRWDDFVKLKRKVQVSDFHCVTGWSVRKVTYEGIPLKKFLEKVGVKSSAKYVKFYSGDGVYTDALSLDQARMDDVMVAVLMDGELIPSDYGGPVRLIVPRMYAYKAVKWLVRIELIDTPHLGYWQVRGYDTDAWVRK
ncbi:molybdopterin-dependent oxidoreductase [Pseudalkalibacillus berkeleyi]|uniref:Molybdopterin-dependent oxidoreductase n=1 Tax=Pseudalkalibacillus berkeleyi TaxID=1069813 RepID=A0ABS9GXJ4_9BACL|nr:molybdopterin-dependent oxidoreductase [Pseudalkalibacillus berkeleyi]MCF6136386.1 molybdopterin-dependent oxidoreductase [Pseudalkalibacillus berkeleyi]